MNEEQINFWEDYCKEAGLKPHEHYVEASIAGNPEIAESLLLLYLQGKKTAGSGLVKDYELAGDDLPKIGNYWLILDSQERPRCLVQTIKVETHLFKDVREYIAKAEGEGDLSLEFWKNAHSSFFAPYLSEWGITDLSSEKVITEFYKVVYKK